VLPEMLLHEPGQMPAAARATSKQIDASLAQHGMEKMEQGTGGQAFQDAFFDSPAAKWLPPESTTCHIRIIAPPGTPAMHPAVLACE
jgi:hypothetical protein